jgi:hypothetical protein
MADPATHSPTCKTCNGQGAIPDDSGMVYNGLGYVWDAPYPQVMIDCPACVVHHKDCYRVHHACAVARLDRLAKAMEGLPPGPWIWDGSDVCLSDDWLLREDLMGPILVAVRDITEGR